MIIVVKDMCQRIIEDSRCFLKRDTIVPLSIS
jgi:hypothetical protein